MSELRRSVIGKIEFGADTWLAAAQAMESIAFRFYEAHEKGQEQVVVTSGGPSSGYTIAAEQDPSITHKMYMDGIELWIAEKRKHEIPVAVDLVGE